MYKDHTNNSWRTIATKPSISSPIFFKGVPFIASVAKVQETREVFNLQEPSSIFEVVLDSAVAVKIVIGLCLIIAARGFAAGFILLIVCLIQVKNMLGTCSLQSNFAAFSSLLCLHSVFKPDHLDDVRSMKNEDSEYENQSNTQTQ